MITYDKLTTMNVTFDASGIEFPTNYLWNCGEGVFDIYYPKVRIVTNLDVIGYENGKFQLEVKCISAVNHETEVADYSEFYCEWDSTNLQEKDGYSAFEWQWRGADTDECPPFYEEVELYIERAYISNEIKAPTSQMELHLKHMVELVEELQGSDLIHLQEDMPQEYGKFVLAKNYVKKFLAICVVGISLVSCQRDTTQSMSQAEWQTLEVINDLEDAKEWLLSDMEEGRIDSTHGYTYLMILDESIDNLITLKTK